MADDLMSELEATPPDPGSNLAGLMAECRAAEAIRGARWEARRDRYRTAGCDVPSYGDMLARFRWLE